MRSSFYRSRGLRTGFPKGVASPGKVTVLRPNGDGILAPVQATSLEVRAEPAVPTHRQLNDIRFEGAE